MDTDRMLTRAERALRAAANRTEDLRIQLAEDLITEAEAIASAAECHGSVLQLLAQIFRA